MGDNVIMANSASLSGRAEWESYNLEVTPCSSVSKIGSYSHIAAFSLV